MRHLREFNENVDSGSLYEENKSEIDQILSIIEDEGAFTKITINNHAVSDWDFSIYIGALSEEPCEGYEWDIDGYKEISRSIDNEKFTSIIENDIIPRLRTLFPDNMKIEFETLTPRKVQTFAYMNKGYFDGFNTIEVYFDIRT